VTLNYNITKNVIKFFNVILCEMCADIAQEPAACVIRLGSLIVMMEGAGCSKTCTGLHGTISQKIRVKQSRYRPELAWRVDRGIALPFRDLGARKGWVVSTMPRLLYPP
jgi:hypothetical protein